MVFFEKIFCLPPNFSEQFWRGGLMRCQNSNYKITLIYGSTSHAEDHLRLWPGTVKIFAKDLSPGSGSFPGRVRLSSSLFWPLAIPSCKRGFHPPKNTHTHTHTCAINYFREAEKRLDPFLDGVVCSRCEIALMLVIFRSNWIFCLKVGIGSFFGQNVGFQVLQVLFYVDLKGDLISFSWN